MSPATSSIYFKIYTIFFIILILILIVLAQTAILRLLFIYYLFLYGAVLAYAWTPRKGKSTGREVMDLSDLRSSRPKRTILDNFQEEAKRIYYEMQKENTSHNQQTQLYSPYLALSRDSRLPQSLSQLPVVFKDDKESVNVFGSSCMQNWRAQIKQTMKKFKQNMMEETFSDDSYRRALQKNGFNIQFLDQAEDTITDFLIDRGHLYCSNAINVISDINKILNRNFGVSLTGIPSNNSREICTQQLSRLLQYYSINRILPSKYKQLSNSLSPSSSFQQHAPTSYKIDSDMQQLIRLCESLEPFMRKTFKISLVYLFLSIMRIQFPSQKIKVNDSLNSLQAYGPNNVFKNIGSSNIYNLNIYYDDAISWTNNPEFRTKNLKKACLVFVFLILKKGNVNGHPLIKQFRRFVKLS